ncbi:hypothetical protein BDZ94DRAFT_1246761 [Collybia nuda]|uniref:Transmembrane protein n=1 Tax=Collybia nuda TaxID=64659 RepID=A0A9P5YGX0_9AGAR|nr:hypothetical protein BDZ94DRAFT_1246761 [Collybia nuda]
MPALSTCVFVLLSIVCYVLQCRALNLPNFARSPRLPRAQDSDFLSNACTTNITIPTLPEECVSPCRLFQETQLTCQDYTNCMCLSAPSFYLQSCMTCVLDGLGDFRHSNIIDETKKVVERYATSCNSIHQGLASIESEVSGIEAQSCIPPKLASSMKATSLQTHLNQTSYHLLFIFMTFVTSVLLLIIACVYPRMWKQFGLI